MENPSELSAIERAALAAWWLAREQQVTTRQIADKLGLSYAGAYYLLQGLCRVLPIRFEQQRVGMEGYWYAIS